MKKYIITSLILTLTTTLLPAQTDTLKQIQLNSGRYCYMTVFQNNFFETNKQHIDLRLGNDNITDTYTNQLHEYIQSVIDKTYNWPIQDTEDLRIDIILNNNGQVKGVEIYTSLDLSNSTVLVGFINEVSKWQKAFEPTFSNDSTKLYLVGWGYSFIPSNLTKPIKPTDPDSEM